MIDEPDRPRDDADRVKASPTERKPRLPPVQHFMTVEAATLCLVGLYIIAIGGSTLYLDTDAYPVAAFTMGVSLSLPLILGHYLAWFGGSWGRRWSIAIVAVLSLCLPFIKAPYTLSYLSMNVATAMFLVLTYAIGSMSIVALVGRLLQLLRFAVVRNGEPASGDLGFQFSIRGVGILTLGVALWLGVYQAIADQDLHGKVLVLAMLVCIAIGVLWAFIGLFGGLLKYGPVVSAFLCVPLLLLLCVLDRGDLGLVIAIGILVVLTPWFACLILRAAGYRLVRLPRAAPREAP